MDLFESIIEKQALMMEAYKDFRDLCDQLKNEQLGPSNQFAEMGPSNLLSADYDRYDPYSFDPIDKDEEAEEYTGAEGLELETEVNSQALDFLDEFPLRATFCLDDIDGEDDPSFYTGRELGIPSHVAIRNEDYQGKLLPIVGGVFKSYGF